MTLPSMDDHKRAGVLRCAGCWRAETLMLSATPAGLAAAEELVASTLAAWEVAPDTVVAVQTRTNYLVHAAIDDVRAAMPSVGPSRPDPMSSPAGMVGFAVLMHNDGIIVEVCVSVLSALRHAMLLGIPSPFGLHWLRHPQTGEVSGRLLWCGVKTGRAGATAQGSAIQRVLPLSLWSTPSVPEHVARNRGR
ncbi:MAG: hypothetical protein ACRDR6_13525 [Pseudonocardiaceae bacterium]